MPLRLLPLMPVAATQDAEETQPLTDTGDDDQISEPLEKPSPAWIENKQQDGDHNDQKPLHGPIPGL
jgi:hypothetical protein